ncbi:hypothetical protein GGX14DRAFT_405482 [Mycena pura]|uniref:Uncharacterized protein n=1 Tax=Mycena pura TaxID=153505 RepID=A0AAD6Y6D3_9AGAR|nr:hypothetical protein GGX14DRAFT_405482 [Mycena pura]
MSSVRRELMQTFFFRLPVLTLYWKDSEKWRVNLKWLGARGIPNHWVTSEITVVHAANYEGGEETLISKYNKDTKLLPAIVGDTFYRLQGKLIVECRDDQSNMSSDSECARVVDVYKTCPTAVATSVYERLDHGQPRSPRWYKFHPYPRWYRVACMSLATMARSTHENVRSSVGDFRSPTSRNMTWGTMSGSNTALLFRANFAVIFGCAEPNYFITAANITADSKMPRGLGEKSDRGGNHTGPRTLPVRVCGRHHRIRLQLPYQMRSNAVKLPGPTLAPKITGG